MILEAKETTMLNNKSLLLENKPKLEARRQRRNEGNLRCHFCLVVVIILEYTCKFEVQDDEFHIFSAKMPMNLITGEKLIRRTLTGPKNSKTNNNDEDFIMIVGRIPMRSLPQ